MEPLGEPAAGVWREQEWEVYTLLLEILGEDCINQIGKRNSVPGITSLAAGITLLEDAPFKGPDGMLVFPSETVPTGSWAWTLGDAVIARPNSIKSRSKWAEIEVHEYVHMLQYRAEGSSLFIWNYMTEQRKYGYVNVSYETHARAVTNVYHKYNPFSTEAWLPRPWQITAIPNTNPIPPKG